jgi:hypothetical protein
MILAGSVNQRETFVTPNFQFCSRIFVHTYEIKDKEEGLVFNGTYHKDQQLLVYLMLLWRLFCRRTRRNGL